MPWCPHCEEMFPEGPYCPRCDTPLLEDEAGSPSGVPAKGNLPQLKVPRKLRRAFDRMDRPPTTPRHLMGFTVFLLVFAGGLLVGRLGSVPSEGPAVRVAPGPIPVKGEGSLGYVASLPSDRRDTALVRHDLRTGRIDVMTRFSLPFQGRGRERTALRALGEAVAFVVDEDAVGTGIGAMPADRPPLMWLEGIDAGWQTPDALLVLADGGGVRRWTFVDGLASSPVPGSWIDLFQTDRGVVLEGIRDGVRSLAFTTAEGITQAIELPADGRVLAVEPTASRALIDSADGVGFWDGTTFTPLRHVEGYRAVAASLAPDGMAVAVVLTTRDESGEILVGIASHDGGVALHPVTRSTKRQCAPEPVWEASGAWVYVAPGDGAIYAVEVGGGRTERVLTAIVDCGIAWTG